MFNFLKEVKKSKSRSKEVFKKYNSFSRYKKGALKKQDCHDLERSIIEKQRNANIEAYCVYCEKTTQMKVDFLYASKVEGKIVPNFRERLVCSECGLNNRLRAAHHLLKNIYPSFRNKRIYITEAITPLYTALKRKIRLLVGSEYFPRKDKKVFVPYVGREVINEDLTNLSFRDYEFDVVMSLEVLEHIPDYKKALAEMFRVLKMGGYLILTVPFVANLERSIVRAKINKNGIEHLLPAEYHGDPAGGSNCLCFYHFGWDIFDDLRTVGFNDVGAYSCASVEFGYLGDGIILYARKRKWNLASIFQLNNLSWK